MKVGTLCYATDQGLGILAKDFVDHGIVNAPIIIHHGHHHTHDEWYPGVPKITSLRDPGQQRILRDFCKSVDLMLFFETPFEWSLVDHCRVNKIKTVIMPMHECMPATDWAVPDAWLCPSLLDVRWAETRPRSAAGPEPRAHFLPVPIDVKKVPWRERTKAETFVHNAGHGGLKGRNGAAEVIKAIKLVKSPAKFIVRSQGTIGGWEKELADAFCDPTRAKYEKLANGNCVYNLDYNGKDVRVMIGTFPYEEIMAEGDVFVFPERFNGLSLPLQEAFASGMMIMCGNRFPMNTWLPNEPLIPVKGYQKNKVGPAYSEIEDAIFDPVDIAATIDAWYGKDITDYSRAGQLWAQRNSWEALAPKYLDFLSKV